MAEAQPKRAWVTLLTRSSYFPGVVTLAYSLRTHSTAYPLVVLITPSLPESCVRALELEAQHNPLLIIHPVEPLLPTGSVTLIAARFEDTWTKLRAFELTSYEVCVFLDADITVYKNMDEVFDIAMPGNDWIAANHSCVCNLDHDSWAKEDWTSENCAWTPLEHPSALGTATPVSPHDKPPHTHTLLNGGLFLYHPSAQLWEDMLATFHSSKELSTYQFPDQDFLASYFLAKWVPLSWKYNALKTMENWHPNIWRDEEVKGLHYIVDKPWNRRVASDGIGGHLGRDGKTHTWWWEVWESWRKDRAKEQDLLSISEELVAKPLDEEGNRKQCEENRAKGLPIPLPDSPARTRGIELLKQEKANERPGPRFPVFRKPRPGEHGELGYGRWTRALKTSLLMLFSIPAGHGPVVRP